MTTPRHVLVIDDLNETATVLQAILEPRGAVVERTRTRQLSQDWAERQEPDVVVVDLDESADLAQSNAPVWDKTPQVVISSARVMVDDSTTRFLQKPFQFPELLRAVEDLLAVRTPA